LDQSSVAGRRARRFRESMARRIDSHPAFGVAAIRERVNAFALASAEEFRRDSSLFLDCVRKPEAQNRIKAAMKRGFQTVKRKWICRICWLTCQTSPNRYGEVG